MIRLIAMRNADKVFPDPVGASSNVFLPSAMIGHDFSCAVVGFSNVSKNQRRSVGWKYESSGSVAVLTNPF